jgi:uroporphyrinogen decarboxylase
MMGRKWWDGPVRRDPDFNNLLKVLRREKPDRPTLFEFFLNGRIHRFVLSGKCEGDDRYTGRVYEEMRRRVAVFRALGYDYATVGVPGFTFPLREQEHKATISANDGAMITDRKSFGAYAWPDPDDADYRILDTLGNEMPKGMKMVVSGPGGALENANFILGFENMCYLIADDERLIEDVFESIGTRLVKHYKRVLEYDGVGAIISNDDWGFKSQTMLSPENMRRFVFPWHKQIVEAAHKAGKPAILHSCGNLEAVMDDIIDDMKFDGKHSYEDTIQPVEQAYEQYGGRIAILGGIDLDFLVRSTPEEVFRRSKAMLERSAGRGSYALGTGNSVPEYVPRDNYFAMVLAATEER